MKHIKVFDAKCLKGENQVQPPATNCSGIRVRNPAFTLIELLVVIAIIGILAAILLPVLNAAKVRAEAIQCMNNKKQLATACAMYPDDWNNYMIPNAPLGGLAAYGWCASAGGESWGNSTENTNFLTYATNCLADYFTKQIKVYSCPGDYIASANGPRIRSISMNSHVVGGLMNLPDAANYMQSGTPLNGFYALDNNWPLYGKVTQLMGIKPVDIWIFCDEAMASINDGYLQMKCSAPAGYPDIPANYHGKNNNFAFQDGHVEEHRWKATLMSTPYGYNISGHYWNGAQFGGSASGNPLPNGSEDLDYSWLKSHTASQADMP